MNSVLLFFAVGGGVYQGSIENPLLFICVLETLFEEFWRGCLEEMLYVCESMCKRMETNENLDVKKVYLSGKGILVIPLRHKEELDCKSNEKNLSLLTSKALPLSTKGND